MDIMFDNVRVTYKRCLTDIGKHNNIYKIRSNSSAASDFEMAFIVLLVSIGIIYLKEIMQSG